MLNRLRRALFQDRPSAAPTDAPPPPPEGGVAGWAARQGLGFESREAGYVISGEADGLAWRLEKGASTREFIRGAELRGRTEMGVNPDIAVLVLNRQLKEGLENLAFAQFTDTLRTVADAQLPEEMRWLSIYEEVTLPEAPIGFHDMYAVLADDARHARDWLDSGLATEMMRWPEAVDEQTPVILMVLRGNVYLRLEMPARDEVGVLARAAALYPAACTRARESLLRAT